MAGKGLGGVVLAALGVRVRRDPGAAPGTHPLIGNRTRMADDDTALWGPHRLSCSEAAYSPKCRPNSLGQKSTIPGRDPSCTIR
jgi:hypothetical protein